MLQEEGMLPAAKESYKARCHRNGALPVNARKAVSKSVVSMGRCQLAKGKNVVAFPFHTNPIRNNIDDKFSKI
jgi:hypothetical protein